MDIIKINGYLHKYASTADRGLNLQFITQELSGEDSAKVQNLLKTPCALIFGDQDHLDALMKVIEEAQGIHKNNTLDPFEEMEEN